MLNANQNQYAAFPSQKYQEKPLAPTRGSSHSVDVFKLPPKRVIKALKSYKPTFVNELAFSEGDFFYVINDLDDYYYEAVDPVRKLHGLVPISCFASLGKVAAPVPHTATPVVHNHNPIPLYQIEQPHFSIANTEQFRAYDDHRHDSSYSGFSDAPTSIMSSTSHSSGYSELSRASSNDSAHSFPGHIPTRSSSAAQPRSKQPSAFLPSPTSPTGLAKMYPGMSRTLPTPVSAHVQDANILSDGRHQFTLELHLSDNTKHVLFRVFDEFYSLHVSLLTQFPVQSGRSPTAPRIIPFLPPAPPTAKQNQRPQPSESPAEQQKRIKALDNYLDDLIQLPPPIQHSPALNRFFMLKKGDVSTPIDVTFDTSSALMDLISAYNAPTLARPSRQRAHTAPAFAGDSDMHIKIKLHLPDNETIMWKVPEDISFGQLLRGVDDRAGWRGGTVWYRDEIGELVKVRGERDWGIVKRGRWGKVVLFVR